MWENKKLDTVLFLKSIRKERALKIFQELKSSIFSYLKEIKALVPEHTIRKKFIIL
jgi:hypothetical protein